MQDICKQLEIARAELAAIETANKEIAIAAAFKRTSRPAARSLVAEAKAEYLSANAEYLSAKAAELDAMDAVHDAARRFDALGEGNTMRRWNVINRLYEAVDEARRRMGIAFDKEVAARRKCDAAVASYRPSFRDTKEAEAKVEALVAMLPKREWRDYDLEGAMAKAEACIEAGEAKIDLLRSRMAAAKAAAPGEAQEWLPLDGDEAAETLAWLETKRRNARNPRRKGDRRNCLTQLDWAQLDAASSYHWDGSQSFKCGKVGRYWADRHSYWVEGYEARTRAAEAAAWER